jgi:CRP-like cAMP-binding protein
MWHDASFARRMRSRKKSEATSNSAMNHLLASLPPAEHERLTGMMKIVSLETKETLYDDGKTIKNVYFPIDGVASMLSVLDEGLVEIATVGNEGMIGVPLFLGSQSSAMRSFQQVPGHAWKMSARDFQREAAAGGPLNEVMRRYTQALFTQIAQSTGCNRMHTIEQRCARWLLMTHDRVASDTFPLTHQFLAQMLGVRRATVTEVMGELQNRGLLTYRRGTVQIVDRKKLEKVSCECYQIIRDEYARLIGWNS